TDKATGASHEQEVTLDRDEGPRPDTTLAKLAALKPVYAGGTTTAGNASQLSDGAAAVVMMNADLAARRGLPILGLFRGMQLAAVAPEEMSIAIAPAIRKLMKHHQLAMSDVDLWELHEAYAVTTLYNQSILEKGRLRGLARQHPRRSDEVRGRRVHRQFCDGERSDPFAGRHRKRDPPPLRPAARGTTGRRAPSAGAWPGALLLELHRDPPDLRARRRRVDLRGNQPRHRAGADLGCHHQLRRPRSRLRVRGCVVACSNQRVPLREGKARVLRRCVRARIRRCSWCSSRTPPR